MIDRSQAAWQEAVVSSYLSGSAPMPPSGSFDKTGRVSESSFATFLLRRYGFITFCGKKGRRGKGGSTTFNGHFRTVKTQMEKGCPCKRVQRPAVVI